MHLIGFHPSPWSTVSQAFFLSCYWGFPDRTLKEGPRIPRVSCGPTFWGFLFFSMVAAEMILLHCSLKACVAPLPLCHEWTRESLLRGCSITILHYFFEDRHPLELRHAGNCLPCLASWPSFLLILPLFYSLISSPVEDHSFGKNSQNRNYRQSLLTPNTADITRWISRHV